MPSRQTGWSGSDHLERRDGGSDQLVGNEPNKLIEELHACACAQGRQACRQERGVSGVKTIIRNRATNAWGKVRVGDALRLINGRAFKPSEWKERGLPIVRIQNLNNAEAPFNYYEGDLPEKFLLNNGDLLFAWSGTPGTSFGAHIWRGGKAWLNQHIFKVMFDVVDFNKKFLQLAINQNLNEYIRAAHGGAGLAHITKGKFEDSELVKPPLEEQNLIVAEIEKQFSRRDEAVANLKRVKANLKRYKSAVLKAAVEGKLAPTAGPWKQVALGDVTTSIRNGYSKKPDAEQGTRIFRISAVRTMKLDTNDVRYLSGTPADYEPFLIEPGDVLFTRYNGNRDYVGVCARVPASLPPTVYPDKLIRVRVPSSMLLPEFLVILASTGRAREYIDSKIRTTAGQSGISGGDLKVLPLDIPRVTEQLQIVAEVERRLSVIDELETAVKANLTRADRLRQSILARAFSGELATLQ